MQRTAGWRTRSLARSRLLPLLAQTRPRSSKQLLLKHPLKCGKRNTERLTRFASLRKKVSAPRRRCAATKRAWRMWRRRCTPPSRTRTHGFLKRSTGSKNSKDARMI